MERTCWKHNLRTQQGKKTSLALKYSSKALSKLQVAAALKISRSSLYYQSKMKIRDQEFLVEIVCAMKKDPAYGKDRLAIKLKANHKKVSRIMNKFNLKPARRRKKPRKKSDEKQEPTKYPNLIKDVIPSSANLIWVSDFTYINFQNKFVYLATVMDVFTRQIIGWEIQTRHTANLVKSALQDAFVRTKNRPQIFHSDQGSEYRSEIITDTLESQNIKISMSNKSSPWQNAYQESFYAGFKLDLGDPDRFESLGELVAEIHQTINYYNKHRIHTALKMSPDEFSRLKAA